MNEYITERVEKKKLEAGTTTLESQLHRQKRLSSPADVALRRPKLRIRIAFSFFLFWFSMGKASVEISLAASRLFNSPDACLVWRLPFEKKILSRFDLFSCCLLRDKFIGVRFMFYVYFLAG